MIKTLFKEFIKSFLISICIIAQLNFAIAQTTTASLLPNAVQQFFDNNGNPLTSGTVSTYAPGTLTFQTTWKDSGETIPNTNPIILDAGGKAIIYGNQTYRQIVKDRNGNLIWDAVTAPGGGGGSTPTLIGDGEPVGTIKQWAGLIVPNQYAYAYGQQLARITFPELLAAITQQLNVACTTGSNNFTAISDTTQINVGSPVELICVAPGTTVVSKTTSSVVLSNPSTLTINTTATFFPFGNGDGSTTFTLPDLRGNVVAGRTNMGGTASTNLTTSYYGISPNTINPASLGAIGGAQSHTQTISEMASHQHSITDPGHTHTITSTPTGGSGGSGTNVLGGGLNIAAAISGTSLTGISQSNLTGGGQAFTIVQPTITLNYIIKTTPDTPASGVTGVSSLGGMQGIIACGQGINCSGNTVSANGQLAGGSNTQIQYNNSGAFGGISGWTTDGANSVTGVNLSLSAAITAAGATFSAAIAGTGNGAASAPAVSITGTVFSGGTSTTTKPLVLIEPSGTTSTGWSTAGTALGVNAASGFIGRLADFQLAGSSKAYIDYQGDIINTGGVTATASVASAVGLNITSKLGLAAPSDGLMQATNWAGTGLTGFILGTNDTSGIRIKKNGTAFNFRLGDDSGDAAITAAGATLSGAIAGTGNNYTSTGGGWFFGSSSLAGLELSSSNTSILALRAGGTEGAVLNSSIGMFTVGSNYGFAFGSTTAPSSTPDTFIIRNNAADIHLGLESNTPIAQQLAAGGVLAGNSNTAGANFTIGGSRGTGTGVGGDIILSAAPPGTSGTAQNARVEAARVYAGGSLPTLRLNKTLVGSLPTCNAGMEGSLYAVTDATAWTTGTTLVGSGSVHALAYCNGSNWVGG